MTEKRRGYCGECEDVTDWLHGITRTRFLPRLVAKCTGCGQALVQG